MKTTNAARPQIGMKMLETILIYAAAWMAFGVCAGAFTWGFLDESARSRLKYRGTGIRTTMAVCAFVWPLFLATVAGAVLRRITSSNSND